MERQTSAKNRVFVAGVGMTKFLKPTKTSPDYPELAKQAIERALRDSGVAYTDVQHACVGYVYGDSTCGQKALYEVGMTGIPIINVNNNCATGSSALYLAKALVEGGTVDCALALGFERMSPGSLQSVFSDRANPLETFIGVMSELRDFESVPFAPQMFGNAGREHMEKYGTTQEQIAKIAYKNHLHSVNNPYSQFRDQYTLEQILKSPTIYYPLTKLQCCPTSNGAACAIVCSEKFMKERKLEDQAVEILSMVMTTDFSSTFTDKSCIKIVGYDMAKAAAKKAYEQAGVKPTDVNVIELHDCFAANELITYEALGLCKEGEAGKFIDSGNNTYGGKYVVNPSGGLISKGHPLGATGLAQCAELTWQLRDMAEKRQVKDAQIALQHNLGLGGACVVGVYKKYNNKNGHQRADQSSDPALLEKFENETSKGSLAKL